LIIVKKEEKIIIITKIEITLIFIRVISIFYLIIEN
jgi:hypothetical protein